MLLISCSAVVCKDHRAAQRKNHRPIFICSLDCTEHFACTVCQAARATSAAPFYFSPQEIITGDEKKRLIDGGFGANNPSHYVYKHFFKIEKASHNPHPSLDWNSLNFVNLGTGTSLDTNIVSKRVRVKQKILSLNSYLPRSLQQALETLVTIKTLATESENAASIMEDLACSDSSVPLRYDRFSATTGVHEIKLDEYKKLNDIRDKTIPYIRELVQKNTPFDLCAQALAKAYLARRNSNAA